MATRRNRGSRARGTKRRRSPRQAREPIAREILQRLIFRTFGNQRFTQDSPLLPDVWLAFARGGEGERQDLILTPHAQFTAGSIALALEWRLERYHSPEQEAEKQDLARDTRIAYNRSSVAAQLTFEEVMGIVVPMTSWWRRLPEQFTEPSSLRQLLKDPGNSDKPLRSIAKTTRDWEYLRFAAVAGFVAILPRLTRPTAETLAAALSEENANLRQLRRVVKGYLDLIDNFDPALYGPHSGETPAYDPRDEATRADAPRETPQVWSISLNRTTQVALHESRATVKGDAANNVFAINTDSVAWAVIDCGIDARHPAFLDRSARADEANIDASARSRVVETYDFAFLRTLLSLQELQYTTSGGRKITIGNRQADELEDLARRVRLGREIDWGILQPLILVPHTKNYESPVHEHGTHVAGILAGHWPAPAGDERPSLVGICPELKLYDMRVFDQHGKGDEFTIMAALQFVAYLNRNRDNPLIHGVNLSLSLRHEVTTYACGRTPICDECERLTGDGVVVVAAAGNEGFEESLSAMGGVYRGISITDPGNAEAVITVGSTHRRDPHTYGVSYFSSRGPTGDGRRKPDLVAPGEKITAPIPSQGWKLMDGTSMAAPHVSGAAALLMARHRELIGRPQKIKQILCKSATDLGREQHFQGAGMLDILRALQSV